MFSKTSYMERLMNRDVIWCVVILLILCMSGAVAGVLWERDARTSQLTGNWYIPSEGDTTENKNELFLLGFYMFLRMVVLLQILIPLSLYITIEIVKLFQAFFISNDLEMYSKEFKNVCQPLKKSQFYQFSYAPALLFPSKFKRRQLFSYQIKNSRPDPPNYCILLNLQVFCAAGNHLIKIK